MNKKFILLPLLIAGTGLVLLSRPRIPRHPGSLAEIEAALQKKVDAGSFPGLSVVVIRDGRVIHSRGFGFADLAGKQVTGPDTVYHWWSLSKIPTAMAVLQLNDQGLLELDEPVSKYIPFFKVTLDGAPAPPVTIRQVLRHTSGLPDTMPAMIGWVHYEDQLVPQTALLEKVLPNYNRLKFSPDTKAAYSNLGYMVLGAVVEAASGESFEKYIENHILKSLGMERTGFLYDAAVKPQAAAGSHPLFSIYTPLLPFFLDMDSLVMQRSGTRFWFNQVYLDATPSSGLIGSAADAALLADALLSRDAILSEESHSLMIPTGDGLLDRPLGWAEYSLGDRMWVQHQGGGPGFATLMRLYPQEKLGIVVMANSTHLPFNAIAGAYAEINW